VGPELGRDPRREFSKRSLDYNFEGVRRRSSSSSRHHHDVPAALCEHCLNPACVARAVGRDLQTRGGRHCPARPDSAAVAHVRVGARTRSSTTSGRRANPRSDLLHPRIEAGQPTGVGTCVGPIRYSEWCSTTPTGYGSARARTSVTLSAQLASPHRNDTTVTRRPSGRASPCLAGIAKVSPIGRWRWKGRWRSAASEYRTLRWYGTCRRCRRITSARRGKIGTEA